MTMEEQDVTIKVALYNEDTMLKETELQESIGKKIPNLVKPQNGYLLHPEADLLDTYATEDSPTNCGSDWSI